MPVVYPNLQVNEHITGRGFSFRCAARLATVNPGTLATDFEAGDSLDGITLVDGDRILIKNQIDPIENGVYIVQPNGTPIRDIDYLVGENVGSTVLIIQEGNVNANSSWLCINDWDSDTVGTNGLNYIRFNNEGRSIILRDEKSTGTAGGTFTSGSWQTRDLNVENNNLGNSILSANQFTLNAGSYTILANAPGYKCGAHRVRIQNITDDVTIEYGSSSVSDPADSSTGNSIVFAHFTLTKNTVLELQHRCEATKLNDGLGLPCNFSGEPEVYAQVNITKNE